MKIIVDKRYEPIGRFHLVMISTEHPATGDLITASLEPYVVHNPRVLRSMVECATDVFKKAIATGQYSNVILWLVLMLSTSAYAQMPLDADTKRFTYSEVVEVQGDKAELYTRARTWFVNAYNDADKVLQMDDKESGTLIGKGTFSIVHTMLERTIYKTVTIEVKDNRYRYTITDFIIHWNNTTNTVEPFESVSMGKQKLYDKTDAHVRTLIANLKDGMARAKRDDW